VIYKGDLLTDWCLWKKS